MTEEQQLTLQALMDGELPEAEARETAAWVARDPEAAALLNELRNTRKALAGGEAALKLPESREFYWSKISREIARLEPAEEPIPAVPWSVRLRRFLMPAGGVAALLIITTLAVVESRVFRGSNRPDTEMTLADSGTFTYHDYANGTTLVWLSYPAESEFAKKSLH